MRVWPLLLVLLLASGPAMARCLAYEPARVSLDGELHTRVQPGPPNYVSIARGDVPETVLILALAAPICVTGQPSSTLNSESHAGIREVQLSMPMSKARPYVGKRVRATGTLFGAHTGHHSTPVVLQVLGLRVP